MAHSVTQYSDITKAYFVVRMSHSLIVHAYIQLHLSTYEIHAVIFTKHTHVQQTYVQNKFSQIGQ